MSPRGPRPTVSLFGGSVLVGTFCEALRAAAFGAAFGLIGLLGLPGCRPETAEAAEAKHDVAWLTNDPSPKATAALGHLADADAHAVSALEKRASVDAGAYLAAWEAVTRDAPWGVSFLRKALTDPTRANVAAAVLPRRDPRVVPFVPDLEGAMLRVPAGQSAIAGVLASLGPNAHEQIERRLLDRATRGAMCDGVGMSEASADAKALLLALPPEGRNHASCVDVVLAMAAADNLVLDWLARTAEPALVTAAAKSSLPCPRVGVLWAKGLVERPTESYTELEMGLTLSLRRCAKALDPTVAELLAKAPRARACIMQAIDPYAQELSDLTATCKALHGKWVKAEPPLVRARVHETLAHGCTPSAR